MAQLKIKKVTENIRFIPFLFQKIIMEKKVQKIMVHYKTIDDNRSKGQPAAML